MPLAPSRSKGILFQPLARPKLLGTARRDGDSIIFRCAEIDSTGIDDQSTAVGIEFARIKTPDEAVGFVSRYGPIGPLPKGLVRYEDRRRGRSVLHKPVEVAEPLQDVLQEAERLRRLLNTAIDAKRASEGGSEAKARLARLQPNIVTQDLEPAERAAAYLGHAMQTRVEHVRIYVDVVSPGRLAIRHLSPTLLISCYLNVAHFLSAKEAIEICEDCARVFVVTDGRQKFCDKKCAGRTRFRRFKERERSEAAPRKKAIKKRGRQ